MESEYPESPRLAVGGVVIRGRRVLLVRRAKAPSKGQWAIPGGRVELGETLQEAVEREVFEETGVRVQAGEICHVFDVVRRDDAGRVRFHYVIVDLVAEYVSGEPRAADDASEAGWLSPDELRDLTVNRNTRELLKKIGFLRS